MQAKLFGIRDKQTPKVIWSQLWTSGTTEGTNLEEIDGNPWSKTLLPVQTWIVRGSAQGPWFGI